MKALIKANRIICNWWFRLISEIQYWWSFAFVARELISTKGARERCWYTSRSSRVCGGQHLQFNLQFSLLRSHLFDLLLWLIWHRRRRLRCIVDETMKIPVFDNDKMCNLFFFSLHRGWLAFFLLVRSLRCGISHRIYWLSHTTIKKTRMGVNKTHFDGIPISEQFHWIIHMMWPCASRQGEWKKAENWSRNSSTSIRFRFPRCSLAAAILARILIDFDLSSTECSLSASNSRNLKWRKNFCQFHRLSLNASYQSNSNHINSPPKSHIKTFSFSRSSCCSGRKRFVDSSYPFHSKMKQ